MTFKMILALTSMMIAVTPLAAKKIQQKPITVTGERITLDTWSGRVSHSLEKTLRYPEPMGGRLPDEGVVAVNFKCSESGEPAQVTVAKSSGSRMLDRAAVRAVERIKSLHPLPEGLTHDQRYQAMLLFAATQSTYDKQMGDLRKQAAARNEWFARQPGRTAMAIRLVPDG